MSAWLSIPGEVHAIIGENGAGKSTLMKLLAGHLQPTRAELRIDGKAVTLTGPVDAERRGIVLVHQEILLAPDLTAAQNVYLGRELPKGMVVDDRAMNECARQGHRSRRSGATSVHRATSARPNSEGTSGSSPRGDLRRTDRFAHADRDPGIAQGHAARRPRCCPPSGERIAAGRYGAPDDWSRRGQALSGPPRGGRPGNNSGGRGFLSPALRNMRRSS
jgi:ABC-type sugar transport system ATPase subunit